MKKKLLLIALPALMVLSGCANVQKDQPKVEEQPVVEFEEDTVAHEEIFGEAVEIKQPAIRKMGELDDKTAYKVGYQIHFDDKSDGDASNDVISIRFIAAINASYSTMVWKRAFTEVSGNQKLTYSENSSDAEHGYPSLRSTVVYHSLSNGGEDVMVAEEGDYSAYTGFIVYSLTNIPYEDYKNSYFGVSLTLTPAEGDAVHTDFYAVKVEKNAGGTASKNTIVLPYEKNGYYLYGTFGGVEGFVDADASKRGGNANQASFTTNYSAGDNFVAIQKTSSVFQIWDGSRVADGDDDFDQSGENAAINTAAEYVIYLNNSGYFYHRRCGVGVNWYVRGHAAGNPSWSDLEESSPYRFMSDKDNEGVLLGVTLSTGIFKVTHRTDYTDEKNWSSVASGGANDGTHIKMGEGGSNIECCVAGTYNIYLNNSWQLYFEFVA